MEAFNSEHFFIESYDPLTGVVTLSEEVQHFHYGDFDDDDAKDFGGLDMRAGVLMLSRNVKILASTYDINYYTKDAWGCNVQDRGDSNRGKRFLVQRPSNSGQCARVSRRD